jgi:hypothetical protein
VLAFENVFVIVDGSNVPTNDCLTIEHLNHLANYKLLNLKEGGQYTASFVGCVEIANYVLISLPYGVKIDYLSSQTFESVRGLILKLIKCIRIFDRHFSGKNEIQTTGKISASFSLLEDYEEFGIIKKYIKSSVTNGKGAINWKKTISKYLPVKSGNSWIYSDVVNRASMHHENHELAILHQWALHHALKHVAYISDEYNYFEDELNSSLSEEDVIDIISRFNSNKDRDIYVLDLIYQLIGQQSTAPLNAIYTRNFNVVWEVVLQEALNHKVELKDKAPKATWNDIGTVCTDLNIKRKYTGASPEVDIIFQDRDELHILDAKYYDIFNNGSRPGLTDLYKQFYYGQAYKSIMNLPVLPHNGLIFPCYMPERSELMIKFSDIEYSVSLKGKSEEITKIPAYVASIEKVLTAFLEKQSIQGEYLIAVSD